MNDRFNPYTDWLGLTVEYPAHHYELLGLSPFVSSKAQIDTAAQIVMARLSKINPGDRAALRVKLRDEIQEAYQTLSTTANRQMYDKRLRATLAGQQPDRAPVSKTNASQNRGIPRAKLVAPRANTVEETNCTSQNRLIVPTSPPAGDLQVGSGIGSKVEVQTETPRVVPAVRHRKAKNQWIAPVLLLAAFVGIAVVCIPMIQKDLAATNNVTNDDDIRDELREPKPQNVTHLSSTDDKHPPKNNQPSIVQTPAVTQPTQKRAVEAETVRAEFNGKMKEVYRSLARRDWAGANLQLLAAGPLATNTSEKRLAKAMKLLHFYSNDYWNAVTASLDVLQSGSTIELETGPWLVVENNGTELVLRQRGRNIKMPINNLQGSFIRELANSYFNESVANRLSRGAFELVDADGSVEKAKAYFKQAANQGTDTKDFNLLIEVVPKWYAKLPQAD